MLFRTVRIVSGYLFMALMYGTSIYGADTAAVATPPEDATLVYVGTYTSTPEKSRGIYLFWLRTEAKDASLVPLGVAAETQDPSFLTLDATRRRLFCANEMDSFDGKLSGAVSSFSIDPATGKLNLINQQPSMGTGPCQLVLDKTGRNVLVANYNNGSVAVLPVDADGRLSQATCVVQDTGKGPNPARQEGPHAHCVTFSPDNHFAFVCDLGIDKVMSYKFDAGHGKLTPNDSPFFQARPGAGPRHMVFHPNGKFAYVINELASTITALAYNHKTGALTEVQTVSSLPGHYEGANKAAEIAIVPSGKFLFASNRGKDTLALFAIDSRKGTLKFVEEHTSGGKTPRHFGIQSSGKHLVICNQDSSRVSVCQMDAANGRLTSSAISAEVPSPACAVFLPPMGAEKENRP
jgi:6-phosphogluconolactonase